MDVHAGEFSSEIDAHGIQNRKKYILNAVLFLFFSFCQISQFLIIFMIFFHRKFENKSGLLDVYEGKVSVPDILLRESIQKEVLNFYFVYFLIYIKPLSEIVIF